MSENDSAFDLSGSDSAGSADANQRNGSIETYNDLFEAFINGATSGEHRKVEIVDDSERTLLVAYNKWVYAEREKEAGVITFYQAWASSDATNASNLQAGRFRKKLDAMSVFHQVALQERVEEGLPSIDGETYETFRVESTP